MPNDRANKRHASAVSSDTKVLSTASALPDCESKPAERENMIDEWAAASVSLMLARVKSVCITEYQWMIEDLARDA